MYYLRRMKQEREPNLNQEGTYFGYEGLLKVEKYCLLQVKGGRKD